MNHATPAASYPFIGAYLPEFPNRWQDLESLERGIGARFGIVSIYQAWGSRYRRFQTETAERLIKEGRTPMITWEPWRLPCDLKEGSDPAHQPEFSLQRIISGDFDSYISEWARCLSLFSEGTIWLRPMHEMNGDWYPWCGTAGNNSSEAYIAAWRHIHSLFSEQGCGQVRWVWSPYVLSKPNTPENALERYWPGDAFVDFTALDGYNWGAGHAECGWQEFEDLFSGAIKKVNGVSSKPLFIGETATCDAGGEKQSWILNAFETLRTNRSIAGMIWFNANKERDWRVESSPAALEAFREGLGRISSPALA